jgi:hypothetical protein
VHCFPILLMHSFCPTPEATVTHARRLVGPKVFMEIEAVAVSDIALESHFSLGASYTLSPQLSCFFNLIRFEVVANRREVSNSCEELIRANGFSKVHLETCS